MGDKKIYPVGDSHAWHGWLKIPDAAPCTAGPMTLYHFGKYKPGMTEKIPMDAIVCFCWGEIDCRCHVFQHPPVEKCIVDLAKEYGEAISHNVKGRDPKKVWVYNVVPPPENPAGENEAFPFRGSAKDRLYFVRLLNLELEQLCEHFGYTFLNVYERYADRKGYLNMDLSDGHVHIADEKPLKEWIDAHT